MSSTLTRWHCPKMLAIILNCVEWVKLKVTRRGIALFVIVSLAIVIRVVAAGILGFSTPPQQDGIEYHVLAQNLLSGKGYSLDGIPTAYRLPIYPLSLAVTYAISGFNFAAVRIVQALLGGVTALLGYALGKQVHGERVGRCVALAVALHPVMIYTATVFYSENVFIPLFIALNLGLLKLMQRPNSPVAALCGLTFGLAALTRPNFFAFLPAFFLWAWVLFPRYQAIKYGAIIAGVALATMLPWAIRNSLVFNGIVGITTGTGVVLWQGNNPLSDGGGVMPSTETWGGDNPPDRGLRGWSNLNEPQSDELYRSNAEEWILRNPQTFVGLVLPRIYRFWSPNYLGIQGELRLPGLVLATYWLVMAGALCMVYLDRANWRFELAFYLFTGFFMLGTGISYGATRYALPLLPFVLMWCSLAFLWCWDKLSPSLSKLRAG